MRCLRWSPQGVQELLTRHGIEHRDELAEVLEDAGVSRMTVYRTFDAAWDGKVSLPVLVALAQIFVVPVGHLILEPAHQAARFGWSWLSKCRAKLSNF